MRAVSLNLLLLLASCCMWYRSDAAHNPDYSLRIYGGTPVNITEVPYMALYTLTDKKWGCGAVIVHEQFLLTVGHCPYYYRNYKTVVTVGTDNVDGGEKYELDKVFYPPKFYCNNTGVDYDLGVIKLKKKLTFSDRVNLIQMANYSLVPKQGDVMETFGFGRTEKGKLSKHLLKVKLPYVVRDKCKSGYMPGDVTDSMICAGGEVGKGICVHDGGDPLVYKGHVIGLASFGHVPCGEKDDPSVYTYVSKIRDFIDSVIKNHS